MFTLRCRQADFVAGVSSLVLPTPAINYLLCCYRWLIIAGVTESMKIRKNFAGNNNTGDNMLQVFNKLRISLRIFDKILSGPQKDTKISCQTPFKKWKEQIFYRPF
jgi:hypothetical protein